MQYLRVVALAVLGGAALVAQAHAAPLVFTTPDLPLPSHAATGLSGKLWVHFGNAGVLSEIDTLAQADFVVNNFAPDGTFTATQVDYPNGPQPTATIPGTNFTTVLGADAGSLFPAILGSHEINNSVMLLTGYFRADLPDEAHTFALSSDDGSRLTIQGVTVVNNDGIHAVPGINAGPVDVVFTTPGLYSLSLIFFESQPVEYGIEFLDNGTVVPAGILYAPPLEPTPHAAVPEPGSLTLLGAALAGLAMTAVMRRRTHARRG